MAEYQLDVTFDRNRWETLDVFTRAYIECAFWTLTDDEGNSLNYLGLHDLSQEAFDAMRADCRMFQDVHGERIASDLSRAGHDFWLTRNQHGAGFWDGDWPEPDASTLTDDAHAYGESNLYLSDDGNLYVE